MALFILGKTKSGKSTTAQKILAPYQKTCHIMGSEFFRTCFGKTEKDFDSIPEFTNALAKFCSDLLKKDSTVNVRWMMEKRLKADQNKIPVIIEGLRNPYEFITLFDPKKDTVVFLNAENAAKTNTVFDQGYDLIQKTCRWMIDAQMIKPDQNIVLDYKTYEDLNILLDHPKYQSIFKKTLLPQEKFQKKESQRKL